jgi:hypothetical protein
LSSYAHLLKLIKMSATRGLCDKGKEKIYEGIEGRVDSYPAKGEAIESQWRWPAPVRNCVKMNSDASFCPSAEICHLSQTIFVGWWSDPFFP